MAFLVDLTTGLTDFFKYSTYNPYFNGLGIYTFATDFVTIFISKLTLCLAFLIVIRGCVPRYRYDFLTKMGWVKFLGYILTIFLSSVLMFLIW